LSFTRNARRLGEELNVTDGMIIEIYNWLNKYVAKEENRTQMVNVMNKFYLDFKYVDEVRSHNPKTARQMLEYWLAVDVYPEYGNEVQKIMNFISEMNTENSI